MRRWGRVAHTLAPLAHPAHRTYYRGWNHRTTPIEAHVLDSGGRTRQARASRCAVQRKGTPCQRVRFPPGKCRSSRSPSQRLCRQRSSRSVRQSARDSASLQAVTRSQRRAGPDNSECASRKPIPPGQGEGRRREGKRTTRAPSWLRRGRGDSRHAQGRVGHTGSPGQWSAAVRANGGAERRGVGRSGWRRGASYR